MEYLIENVSKSPYIIDYKFKVSKFEIDDEKINDLLNFSKKNLQLTETKGAIEIKVYGFIVIYGNAHQDLILKRFKDVKSFINLIDETKYSSYFIAHTIIMIRYILGNFPTQK